MSRLAIQGYLVDERPVGGIVREVNRLNAETWFLAKARQVGSRIELFCDQIECRDERKLFRVYRLIEGKPTVLEVAS